MVEGKKVAGVAAAAQEPSIWERSVESSFVVPTACLGEVAATVRASGPA
jgi:hypothetical protein